MSETVKLLVLGLGVLILATAGLPPLLKRAPLSLPILLLAAGFALAEGAVLPQGAPEALLTRLAPPGSELALIVALMGSGLKIDRSFSLKGWSAPWRLLGLAMPATIVCLAAAAHWLSHLGWPTALLAGAVLSPTDPVLASAVEVGPPGEGGGDEVRFALTAEAGFNDGLAYPAVLLGLALAGGHPIGAGWALDHFLWRLMLSLASGLLLGRLAGWLVFQMPVGALSASGNGMVALGLGLACFAVVDLLGGYGFVGVFASALALRAVQPSSPFHRQMSDFMQQVQSLLVLLLLLVFGASLGAGLLRGLTWREVSVAALLLFVIRPACAWLSLLGAPIPVRSRALIAFFGVRGIGAIFYLMMVRGALARPAAFDALVAAAVAGSILVHGTTSSPLFRRLEARRADSRPAKGQETGRSRS